MKDRDSHEDRIRKGLMAEVVEKLEMRYVWACGRDAERPTVLLLAARDPGAPTIAACFEQEDHLAASLARRRELGGRGEPLMFWGLPWRVAVSVVAGAYPAFAKARDAPPPPGDRFPVIVVAAGGFAVYGLPLPPA